MEIMKNKASAVIVGGGVLGASIAYNLALRGQKDVVLVEQSYLTSGATGRCGAGVRQQWGTDMNCILSRESVRIFETLSQELDYPEGIDYRQNGYLLLAFTQKEMDQFKKNVTLQNRHDIPSRILTPSEARDIVPHLNTEGLLGAAYCATDGHANPFHTTFAYARAAQRLGVKIYTHTQVLRIEKERGRVSRVVTCKGNIDCEMVINTAGGHAAVIGEMVGLDLPIYPERHQIMVTEPVDAFQVPMVLSMYHHFYIQQTSHGSFLLGMGDPHEPASFNTNPSWQFAVELAKMITAVLPPLKNLNMVRQWAGLYDMCPDAQPVLGESPEVKGFYTAAGFSGHGFMIAPYTSRLMAAKILGEKPELSIDMLNYDRFATGQLIYEPAVV
jgi:sarcosine oxidase, subunit beta